MAVGAAASFLAVVNISRLQERSEPDITGRVCAWRCSLPWPSIHLPSRRRCLVGRNLTVVFLVLAAGSLLILTALLGATSRTMQTAN
jgi:hypothetical protein